MAATRDRVDMDFRAQQIELRHAQGQAALCSKAHARGDGVVGGERRQIWRVQAANACLGCLCLLCGKGFVPLRLRLRGLLTPCARAQAALYRRHDQHQCEGRNHP